MKCPQCNYNQPRGKEGMTCRQCGYSFEFDPQKKWRITDGKFLALVRKTSRSDTYYYTEDELYHTAVRKFYHPIGQWIGVGLFCCLFFGGMLQVLLNVPFLIGIPLVLLTVFGIKLATLGFVDRKTFNHWLADWQKTNFLAKLIPGPTLEEAPEAWPESDLYDYGAARLIICEEDIQVDWLVLNNFHSDNATPVISESGYPRYLTEHIQELIGKNPDLHIFLLHNAGSSGEQMAERMRESPIWKIADHQTTDLGITIPQVRQWGVSNKLLKHYDYQFPVHGLNYHRLNRLFAYAIGNSCSLQAAYQEISGDGGSCDIDFG